MNDLLVKDWIKRRKAQDELANLPSRDELQQDVARLKIELEGPKFWSDFVKELALNIEGISEIGCSGKITTIGNLKFEEQCRVQVMFKSLRPKQTFTDLFYSNGAIIRCSTCEGDAFQLSFGMTEKGSIGVFCDDGPMNPEETAEFIVRRMVDIVSPSRRQV